MHYRVLPYTSVYYKKANFAGNGRKEVVDFGCGSKYGRLRYPQIALCEIKKFPSGA